MSGNVNEYNTRAMTVAAEESLVRASLKSHSFCQAYDLTRILVLHVEWLRKAQDRRVYTSLAGF